jgi:hypothetical protein
MRAVNLIPADQRRGTSVGAGRSQGAAYALLGLFAALAVMMVLYGLAAHDISSSKKQAATLAARTQRAEAETAQLAPYTSFIAMRRARTEAVAQLVDSRFDWAHAFHEFARVLPSDASITALQGTIVTTSGSGASGGASSPSAASSAVSAPSSSSSSSSSGSAAGAGSASAASGKSGTVASATPPGSVPTFIVSGCAKSQSAVAETIDRLRLIDGVNTVTLQSATKSGPSSGGSSSASGSGGCESNQVAYTLTVAYQPLPTPSAASTSEAKVVVATASTSGKAGAQR